MRRDYEFRCVHHHSRVSVILFYFFVIFTDMAVNVMQCYANHVDPYRMQLSAASDLGLRCWPISFQVYGELGTNGLANDVKMTSQPR